MYIDYPDALCLGASHSAACLLVVIDKMEGSVLARALALQVLQVALSGGEYALVAELLRYAVTQSDFDRIFLKGTVTNTSPAATTEGSLSSWFSWMWGGSDDKGQESSPDHQQPVLSGASLEAAKVLCPPTLNCSRSILSRSCANMYGVC